MRKILLAVAALIAVSATAEVLKVPESPFSNAGVRWTEKADGIITTYRNDEVYPWQLASFEISQPASTTNTFTIVVTRFFDYEETVVGDVTADDPFGVSVTTYDPTVTGRTWKTMKSQVFTVTQGAEHGVYSPDTTTVLPSGIYIDSDTVIEVKHSVPVPVQVLSLEGFEDADANGVYAKADDNVESRAAFEKGDFTITWDGTNKWEIKEETTAIYEAQQDVATPDLVDTWIISGGIVESDGDAIAQIGPNVYFRLNGIK